MNYLKSVLLLSVMCLTSGVFAQAWRLGGCPPISALKFIDGRWVTGEGDEKRDWGAPGLLAGNHFRFERVYGSHRRKNPQYSNVVPTRLNGAMFKFGDTIVDSNVHQISCVYDTQPLSNDPSLDNYQIVIREPIFNFPIPISWSTGFSASGGPAASGEPAYTGDRKWSQGIRIPYYLTFYCAPATETFAEQVCDWTYDDH